MVKDILLDIEAGDVQIAENPDNAFIYYETIWGKVFDTDSDGTLFLNIIVPYSQAKALTFQSNGTFSCNILAQYFPDDRGFNVRFVLEQNGTYTRINSQSSFPESTVGKSYMEDFYSLQPISACQLMNINENGKYCVVIKKDDLLSAEIYSFGNNDLLFGESDDQSAKLLSLCAPGKNYRYPISGVGITDYINTVVGDTELGKRMVDEFSGNGTPVISANFDNGTGNLIVSQSSEQASEIEFEELTEEDVEIISSADDDFIRRFSLSVSYGEFLPSEIINEISELSDIYSINILGDNSMLFLCEEKLDGVAIAFGKNTDGKCGFIGISNNNFVTLSSTLNIGDLIYLNNRKSLEYTDENGTKTVIPPFVLLPFEDSFDGSEMEDNSYFKRVSFSWSGKNNDECAIITKKCKIIYSCYLSDYNNKQNGIYKITVNEQSVKNLLVLTNDHITGRLIAYISANSNITEIRQNKEKGQLIILKDDNE